MTLPNYDAIVSDRLESCVEEPTPEAVCEPHSDPNNTYSTTSSADVSASAGSSYFFHSKSVVQRDFQYFELFPIAIYQEIFHIFAKSLFSAYNGLEFVIRFCHTLSVVVMLQPLEITYAWLYSKYRWICE